MLNKEIALTCITASKIFKEVREVDQILIDG